MSIATAHPRRRDAQIASRSTLRRARWLLCVLAGLAATACVAQSGGRADAPSVTGSVSGAIAFPDGPSPALRICALGEANAAGVVPRHCVDTPAGARDYRIAGLAPGAYSVLAETRDARRLSGGHLRAVQCIRAPCPEVPADVTVTAGGDSAGIDVAGFQAHRDDLPALSGND